MALKKRTVFFLFFSFLLLSVWLLFPEVRAKAGGLIEEAVGATGSLYDKYALDAYELDFWVDEGFSLDLGEKISGGLSYMVYQITLAIWGFVRALGYFAGQLVQEAYEMDFIGGTVTEVSASMQRLAGIGSGGLMSRGLIPSFLPLLVLVMGAYVAYVAVVKFQASKALRTVLAFVLVGVLGMGMIAGAGQYLGMLNDFQKEFNQEVLAVTDTVAGEEGGTQGIRDNLFSILVYEPYLLLQYGTTDVDAIGQERIDSLLSAKFGSEERREIAKTEAQDLENENISASRAAGRLGTALLVFLLDLVIIVCVALFCAVMIFSQVLFSLYAMFLPVAFLFSLLPGSMGNFTRSLERVFGCVLRKAGITVILSVVFSLSSMAYSLAGSKGFLWVAFLQIVIYVGAFMKCSELLGFMRIGTDGEERAARKMRGRASALIQTVIFGKALGRIRGASGGQKRAGASSGDREAPRRQRQGAAAPDASSMPAPSGRRAMTGGASPDSQPLAGGRRKEEAGGHAPFRNEGAGEGSPASPAPPDKREESPQRTRELKPPKERTSSAPPSQSGQEKEGEPSGRRRQKHEHQEMYEGSHGRSGHAPKASPGSSQPVPSDRLEQDKGRDAGRPNGGEKRRKKDYADAASMPPSPSSPAPSPDQGMKEPGESPKASRASEKKREPGQRPPVGRMAKEIGEPGQRPLEERASKEQGEAEPKAPAAPASADRKKDFHERHSDIYSKSVKENAPDSPGRDPARSRDVGYKKGGVGFAYKPTKFSNFEEREYDMDVLEDLLLEASRREAKGWPDGAKR